MAIAPGVPFQSDMRGAGTLTILFTDIVDSSRLLADGDAAADIVRRNHFDVLRGAITHCHGREIKTLGDGVMAVFDSAIDAVACAVRIQRAVEAPLAVRVGVHTGEPIRERNDYFGTPVVVARRLCDAAEGGQILTSDLVRGLVQSRGTAAFVALGARALKGVDESVDVCEVDWRALDAAADPESHDGSVGQIRVLIADDHPVFRDGLAALLEPVDHIDVVGLATNGREAVDTALALGVDVVVMDLQMPELNGIEATRTLLGKRPDLGVLVLTMFEDDDSVFAAMRAGARGYILKGAAQAKIVQAIELIASGEAIFGAGIAQRMIAMFAGAKRAPEPFPDLTDREREVLELLAQGLANEEITRRLVVSPKTVRNHVSNIFTKLQVADRSQAIVRAREAGLGRPAESERGGG